MRRGETKQATSFHLDKGQVNMLFKEAGVLLDNKRAWKRLLGDLSKPR